MTITQTDREGIQELYARYPFEIDGNNADELADCFTEDGVFHISGQGAFQGPDAIKEVVNTSVNGRPRHLTLNLWIREVTGDEARSQAYFMLVDTSTGQNVAYGHYSDQPVRCPDGRWRFKHRGVQFEWTTKEYAEARAPKAVPLD
jgi:ketosteroid isomerase-like protein